MKILSFGEILLRMSPAPNGRWIEQQTVPSYIGGAECNVAMALAHWNMPVKYMTAMPDNYVTQDIITYLQTKKIDTSSIRFSGNRLGLYYMQQGADLKNAGTIYDRKYSAFYDSKPGDINWDEVLQDVSWFHFSALTPALNQTLVAVCKEALEAAAERGIPISVDLNYRAKLWQYGKEPLEVMPELVQYADVIMGNIWAANTMLAIPLSEPLIAADNKEMYIAHAQQTSEAIQTRFPKCRTVANTFRFDKAEKAVIYYGTLFQQGKIYASATYENAHTKDKAGSGDCFMAGLIYGLIKENTPQHTLDYATAAAFHKLNEIGDQTSHSEQEIWKFIKKGNYNG
jgi:2-dehydro-3-deoxygluconokinase